jgi:hypothetical protein
MPKHVCRLAAAVVMLFNGAAVSAHDFYDEECCHGQDCRPVPCEQIHRDHHNDYVWDDGTPKALFYKSQMRISLDGRCHICVSRGSPYGICIYLPPGI